MMRRSLIVLSILAAACASSYEEDPPSGAARYRYSGHETGPVTVGVIPDIVLRDANNQELSLTIDYPTRGTAHPLIVFVPATGLTHRDYVGLSSYWAANNYVVVRLGRAGADTVRLALDSLDSLEQRYPELQGKIDRTRIGVAGHAEGTQTVMDLASDARVKAVVILQPAEGPDVRLPALFIAPAPPRPAAANETPAPLEMPPAYVRAPAGDKWAILIQGARFQSFTGRLDDVTLAQARGRATEVDIFGRDPMVATPDGRLMTRADAVAIRQQDMFAIVRGAALAFFDTYVKGDAAARTALEKVADRRGVTLEKK